MKMALSRNLRRCAAGCSPSSPRRAPRRLRWPLPATPQPPKPLARARAAVWRARAGLRLARGERSAALALLLAGAEACRAAPTELIDLTQAVAELAQATLDTQAQAVAGGSGGSGVRLAAAAGPAAAAARGFGEDRLAAAAAHARARRCAAGLPLAARGRCAAGLPLAAGGRGAAGLPLAARGVDARGGLLDAAARGSGNARGRAGRGGRRRGSCGGRGGRLRDARRRRCRRRRRRRRAAQLGFSCAAACRGRLVRAPGARRRGRGGHG